MARVVYTDNLFSYGAIHPWEQTFTVPAGFKAVILEYSGAVFNAGLPGVRLLIAKSSNGNSILNKFWPPYWTGEFRIPRHQVLEAGDGFVATMVGGGADVELDLEVNGWLLTLP